MHKKHGIQDPCRRGSGEVRADPFACVCVCVCVGRVCCREGEVCIVVFLVMAQI